MSRFVKVNTLYGPKIINLDQVFIIEKSGTHGYYTVSSAHKCIDVTKESADLIFKMLGINL